MKEKNVLVLFYDEKDKKRRIALNEQGSVVKEEIERKAGRGVYETTLGAEFVRGFCDGKVNATFLQASPSHEPWLVKRIFNRYVEGDDAPPYDGIIVVAGLSCTSDMPRMLMDELYNEETVSAKSVDWDKNVTMKSKYFGRARYVPIIGVPTKDQHTNGHRAFFSMIEVSSPRDAVCVGIEHGYAAAQLIDRMLSNQWNRVRIIVPSMTSGGLAYQTGLAVKKELDEWFDPEWFKLDGGLVEFGLVSFGDFIKGPNKEELDHWRPSPNILPVCIYDDIDQLRKLNSISDCVIGVSALEQKLIDEQFVEEITDLDHVLHSRSYKGENAAMFVAQCLSMHPYKKTVKEQVPDEEKSGQMKTVEKTKEVWLNAEHFRKKRMERSRLNVEAYAKK